LFFERSQRTEIAAELPAASSGPVDRTTMIKGRMSRDGPLSSSTDAGTSRHEDGAMTDPIGSVVDGCVRAWPDLRVDLAAFARHLVARGGATCPHAADVYLAFGCARGDPAAIAAFDREVLVRVRAYLGRLDASAGLADEVTQALRHKLLVSAPGAAPLIATYEGRAPLASWVRPAAVRLARTLLQERARDVRLDTERAVGERAREHDPETALLKERDGTDVNRALERALARMPEKDRALLRLYFVEGLSLQAIGRMYHAHESTLSRRIAAVRAELVEAVRVELGMSAGELDSLVALVRSRLEVDLARHLAKGG
jgi:RNA polymerase sigma-70 factor (ECF subfamily)